MGRYRIILITVILGALLHLDAFGAQTGTSLVTFSFQEVDEIAVSGAPTLTINTAVAGQQPQPAVDTSSTYSISTNGTNKRITASISKQMPVNTTLEIQLAAPAVGTSKGYVSLSTTAADVVTGISQTASPNRSISYRFSATTAAGVLTDSCTVTLTLSD